MLYMLGARSPFYVIFMKIKNKKLKTVFLIKFTIQIFCVNLFIAIMFDATEELVDLQYNHKM